MVDIGRQVLRVILLKIPQWGSHEQGAERVPPGDIHKIRYSRPASERRWIAIQGQGNRRLPTEVGSQPQDQLKLQSPREYESRDRGEDSKENLAREHQGRWKSKLGKDSAGNAAI